MQANTVLEYAFFTKFSKEWNEVRYRLINSGADLSRIMLVPEAKGRKKKND